MFSELDHGIRCDKHVGEVFPPRCADCAAAALEHDQATAPVRFGRYLPNSKCSVHRGWPLPCDRCAGGAR